MVQATAQGVAADDPSMGRLSFGEPVVRAVLPDQRYDNRYVEDDTVLSERLPNPSTNDVWMRRD